MNYEVGEEYNLCTDNCRELQVVLPVEIEIILFVVILWLVKKFWYKFIWNPKEKEVRNMKREKEKENNWNKEKSE